MKRLTYVLMSICLSYAPGVAFSQPGKQSVRGLNPQAMEELADAGVDKYMGEFTPFISEDIGGGWVKHSYDPEGGNGPICVAGTPFSAYTKAGNPAKLLIMLQGGGAC